MSTSNQDEAATGIALLDQIRPGAAALVATLARRLARDPRVASHLAVGPDVTGEADIAAHHGAAYLALAVATAAVVLPRVGVGDWATQPPTVLGVAIGTAALLLRETPMPGSYAAALLARIRDEYRVPQQTHGLAPVSGHRLALLEEPEIPEVDFSGNGLVAVVPGGVVIRTGLEAGHVQITIGILDGPPPASADGWEDIVEVSWRAAVGRASIVGQTPHESSFSRVTPPWARRLPAAGPCP
jgi:hypothetical protein